MFLYSLYKHWNSICILFFVATLLTMTRQNRAYFVGFVLLVISCLVTNHIITYMKEKLSTNAVPIKPIHCWFRLQSPEGVSSSVWHLKNNKIIRGHFDLKVYFSNNVVDFYSYLKYNPEWKITFDTLIVFSSQAQIALKYLKLFKNEFNFCHYQSNN